MFDTILHCVCVHVQKHTAHTDCQELFVKGNYEEKKRSNKEHFHIKKNKSSLEMSQRKPF